MKIHVTLTTPEGERTLELKARQGWTLYQLSQAGMAGITALERPALRLAAYIHRLRERGFLIETEMEEHEGTYAGRHARYRLLTAITAIRVLDQGGAQ